MTVSQWHRSHWATCTPAGVQGRAPSRVRANVGAWFGLFDSVPIVSLGHFDAKTPLILSIAMACRPVHSNRASMHWPVTVSRPGLEEASRPVVS